MVQEMIGVNVCRLHRAPLGLHHQPVSWPSDGPGNTESQALYDAAVLEVIKAALL